MSKVTMDARTLALVIQAVDFKIAALEQTLESLPPNEGGDLELLLVSYESVAHSLEVAYQDALAKYSNLPAYAELVCAGR